MFFYLKKINISRKFENKHFFIKTLNSILFFRQKGIGTLKCGYEKTPSYFITFTCQRCLSRTTHRMTKQAYHNGTVIIQCPRCKNRHLISDHLKIFSDKNITIEDIMKEKGEKVCKYYGEFANNQVVESVDKDIKLLLERPKNE
ncbi:hypothetical protein PNEG_02370 [Pneumocystis murina B123]|uniref:DNL-type domain-containing protein n=1 Tax=Pneumocystis murina (strain B123) TaxID=1069680 RepID=M7NQ85_PNEMU|nr:hypothetical protein PNEG_02370 [Pneumocystis murina B123]EMR09427.1 hypothetical protein PNEG_02370 [Pneumocystis murina B123]